MTTESSSSWVGEELLEFVEQGLSRTSGESALDIVFEYLATASAAAPASGGRGSFVAPRPSAALLFDSLAYDRDGSMARQIGERFEVLARPGDPVPDDLQAGDIVIERALGEGRLAHAAVIAGPAMHSRELASRDAPHETTEFGLSVQVVEAAPVPRHRRDLHFRRLTTENAHLGLNSLIMRIRPGTADQPPPVSRPVEAVAAEARRTAKAARFRGDAIIERLLNNERVLKLGSRGGATGIAVGKIQSALIDLGYTLPVHGVDRRYGSETRTAVRQFQNEHPGLSVNGEVRVQTMRQLDALFRVLDRPCGAPTRALCDPTSFAVAAPGRITYDLGRRIVNGVSVNIRGTVYYPADSAGSSKPFSSAVEAIGPAPIVFMAHGNHATFSDPADRTRESCFHHPGWLTINNHDGYHYFQETLAKLGMISVSVDCNDANCRGGSPTNIRLRSAIVLESIRHLIALNAAGSGSILESHIDFGKTGLLGHSRGGEAVLVVPGDLAAGGSDFSAVKVLGVISLAPTDFGTLPVLPTGFALMAILPAADGDVVENDGAKFYDRMTPGPFKCQLYVHRTNHNRFNREWPVDEWTGPAFMSRPDHERIVLVYGSAFFGQVLLRGPFMDIVMGRRHVPGVRNADIHISAEQSAFTTVDDHENANITINTLGQTTTTGGSLTATEVSFRQPRPSFFHATNGMLANSPTAYGTFRSPLSGATDLSGKEVWVRAAELYGGSAMPASATRFQIGLEDATGTVAFVGSGLLPRPFDRRTHDIAAFGTDFTKTMLKTVHFPADCLNRARPKLDVTRIQAIIIRLTGPAGRQLAFDQLQVS